MQTKILILMSDTGGGHRAAAEAIAEATALLYGNQITVRIVDAWRDHSPWPLNQIGGAYPWLVSDGLWLWQALWRTDGKRWPTQVAARLIFPVAAPSLAKMFRAEAPGLVVTVHPILNHICLRVLRETLKSDVPYVTVVTDLVTAHSAWFCPCVDYCVVPTQAARQRALRYGMPPARVEAIGQPVGLEFAMGLEERHCLRGKLSLDTERPAVLLVSGGEGMGPVYETARAVATRASGAQLIVVAGRNAALRQKLEATAWEIPTRVYGFVNNMPELMGASDVLITKAGPGTLSEAFIAGLPVLMFSFIPGQEEGNVDYVLEHKAGAYASDPAEIGCLIQQWLKPNNCQLRQMATNAAALARPQASLTIARRLHRLLHEKSTRTNVTENKPVLVKKTQL